MEPAIQLKYCPACSSNKFKTGGFKPWKCPDCSLELFQNTAGATAALIFNSKGELLTIRRALEPSKGKLGVPGGFIDANETAEESLIREVKEETNLDINNIKYLCSFPNTYPYKGIFYNTLALFFTADAINLENMASLDEVDSLEWHKPHHLNKDEFAFTSLAQALEHWNENAALRI